MADDGMMRPADFAAMMGNEGMGGSYYMWMLFIFAFLFGFGGNGFGGWGNGNMQGDMQRGFDNQNSMANQREILSAVNQSYHDTAQYVGDRYAELDRDILGVGAAVQQGIASQQQCCCETKMLVSQTAADQRYESAQQTSQLMQAIQSEGAQTRAAMQQDKIEALNQRIAEQNARINAMQTQAEIQQATAGVIRYPNQWVYNAGQAPFCTCNCNMGYGNI